MAAVSPLEYAIKMEQDGQVYYTCAAAKTANPLGKRMFESLAEDERRHETVLRQMAAERKVTVADDLPKRRLVTLFGKLGRELRRQVDAGADDTRVIEKAIEMEKASEAHYRTQARQAGSTSGQALYERLALEESQHVDILNNTLTYLNDTGHWFVWDEKALLD
jgi:rubrerythrin